MRRITHRKTPGAGPTGRRVRRFLMGCSGWPGSVCFVIGASCTRPPAHGAYRPDRRASGYRVCPCSSHSSARRAPRPEDHRRGPPRSQTGATVPDHRKSAASFRFPPFVLQSFPQFVQGLGAVALDGAAGHSHKTADLTVCQLQHTMQNQNALLLFRQTGKGVGHQLVTDMQGIAIGCE